MASETETAVKDQQKLQPKVQIYPSSNGEISAFWRDKYEREAKKYWDIFYKRHQDKFFKDRHYLDKEWGHYFSGAGKKVILEVGCGAGNTIFPLLSTYPDIFVNACDFSPRAVNLVKMHKEFTEARVNAFVCDLTGDDLTQQISPSSVDVVTMIFVLSAVNPQKMSSVLQNIRKVLKPNGYVLFRDYATGDLAQERLTHKEQKISENFYVRGDGTRAYYFDDDFLANLVKDNGFSIEEHVVCCKQVENRSREIVMNRRWVQAVFRKGDTLDHPDRGTVKPLIKDITPKDTVSGSEIDISDGMAAEMFGIESSREEIVKVELKDYYSFKIKLLSREYQHTCKSTGLMLWESARLMAYVLARNSSIASGKRVLELGCGCAGICSMVAAQTADFVIATDGDMKALDLLTQNVSSNLDSPSLAKLTTKKLEWANGDDIEAVKQLCNRGFDVIIGTDVAYVAEAILPLFTTAKELIKSSSDNREQEKAALILCHIPRRVDEPSILSAASESGFRLVARWPEQTASSLRNISDWFLGDNHQNYLPTTALCILYFERVE